MERIRGTLARTALALALLVVTAVAAAGGCASPPDRSGAWQFVDDLVLNMRLVAQGPVAYGTYSTVDRRTNFSSSTLEDATLSWSGYKTVTWSANILDLGGRRNSRVRESLRVTVDVPPMKEALFHVRDASRYDFYTFDAGCLWFNTDTHEYRTAVAEYGVDGSARRAWHASSVSMRNAY